MINFNGSSSLPRPSSPHRLLNAVEKVVEFVGDSVITKRRRMRVLPGRGPEMPVTKPVLRSEKKTTTNQERGHRMTEPMQARMPYTGLGLHPIKTVTQPLRPNKTRTARIRSKQPLMPADPVTRELLHVRPNHLNRGLTDRDPATAFRLR